jgi:TRAP-type C4-dicarboxylate transport system permease small subunit
MFVVQKLIDHCCRLLSVAMVGCLGLMVVLVFGNVVLRYGFNSGIAVSEELSRWLFVWMTFMGALVAMRDRAHLGTDTLISRLPLGGKRLCMAIAQLLMLFICWQMFTGAWAQTVVNLGTTSAVMEVSMAGFYASGVVFAVMAGLVVLNDLYKLLSGQLSEADLIGVRESDDMPTGQPEKPASGDKA